MAKDRKEYFKQYYKNNLEKYNKKSKNEKDEYRLAYQNTPLGRAANLLGQYKRMDNEANRGKSDLTNKWIVENILFQPCAHCGKEGWKIIGCNRLDNSKPHTKDNVEPCCFDCNLKLAADELSKHCDKIDPKSGEVLASFNSMSDAAKDVGCSIPLIKYCCCGGKYDIKRGKWVNHYSAKGYVWKSHL